MTDSTASGSIPPATSLWSAFVPLLPFMLTVFVGFLAMGMALPIVPRHVHDTLRQGPVVVGVVMGSQYLASVFARMSAGGIADGRGPKRAALLGLLAGCGVGALYLASAAATDVPPLALALVVVARLLTGVTEAFVITSTMAWGLARVGPAHAGKVFGWMGVALFGGFAVGAPLGTAIYARFGFDGVALAVLVVSLAGLLGASGIAGVAPSHLERLPFTRVLHAVKLPGLGLTLCSMGYAMLTAFAVLLFAQRGWNGGALALTFMGAGFIAARLLFGHLPDQVGGARVAMFVVIAEAIGLALVWIAASGGGVGGCRAGGRRLRPGLPGLRRGGSATHAAAKPRLGDGRVRDLPGCRDGTGAAVGWSAGGGGGTRRRLPARRDRGGRGGVGGERDGARHMRRAPARPGNGDKAASTYSRNPHGRVPYVFRPALPGLSFCSRPVGEHSSNPRPMKSWRAPLHGAAPETCSSVHDTQGR
jgi:MFS family permease